MLRVSPADGDSDCEGWLFETLVGIDANLADLRTYQTSPVPPSSPLEYRTLFDSKGIIFNTRRPRFISSDTLQVGGMPHDFSPSKNLMNSVSNPSSPDEHQIAAVLHIPTSLCPNLALLHCIEEDPGRIERELAPPRGRFLRTATSLHTRLLDLDSETSCLLYEGLLLRHGFQEVIEHTDMLMSQARKLQQDIRDVLYLNDVLLMLQGRMEKLTPRRWPFLWAHDDALGEVNLVI